MRPSDPPTRRFLRDLPPPGGPDTIFPGERIFGHVAIQLQESELDRAGTIALGSIRALEPGKGWGSWALKLLCGIADRHGVTITLTADPDPDPAQDPSKCLSASSLIAWYERHGFVARVCDLEDEVEGDAQEMNRSPRSMASSR